MRTIGQIRHERLLALLDEVGGVKALADRVDVSSAQISQLKNQSTHSTSGRPRMMGDDFARKIEAALGKPTGWMDTPLSGKTPDQLRADESPTWWPFSVSWARYAALKQAQKEDLDGLVAYQIGVYERKNRIWDEPSVSELAHPPARSADDGERELMKKPDREQVKRSGESK